MRVALSGDGRRPRVYVDGAHWRGLTEGNSGSTEVISLQTALGSNDTHDLPADPVVGVVEGVALPLEQLGEQGAQVLVVGLFEEVQAPHVSQVGGHLLCTTAGPTQV